MIIHISGDLTTPFIDEDFRDLEDGFQVTLDLGLGGAVEVVGDPDDIQNFLDEYNLDLADVDVFEA